MDQITVQCPRCEGQGKVQEKVESISLSAGQNLFEEVRCTDCNGTGRVNPEATIDEFKGYFDEPSQAPEDLLELAMSAARASRKPREMGARTEWVDVSYGFLGLKTRREEVRHEFEEDYWVLERKNGYERRVGKGLTRKGTLEEEDEIEVIFCLTVDGSLQVLRRKREAMLWGAGVWGSASSPRYEPGRWSDWEPQAVGDLDHFMVDFDFRGHGTSENPGCFESTSVMRDVAKFYLHPDPNRILSLYRVYPKGVGLYLALKGLLT